ncbi:hypothetical protein D3C73_20860 [compost metagenome]
MVFPEERERELKVPQSRSSRGPLSGGCCVQVLGALLESVVVMLVEFVTAAHAGLFGDLDPGQDVIGDLLDVVLGQGADRSCLGVRNLLIAGIGDALGKVRAH